jgi:hypothetical protein
VSNAPAFTVRLLHTGVEVPDINGCLAGADGIVTLLAAVGTPAGLQLLAVFQAVLLAPVQVLVCEKAVPDTRSIRTIANKV